MLIAVRKRLGDDGSLTLEAPPAHVRKVLELTGVSEHVTITSRRRHVLDGHLAPHDLARGVASTPHDDASCSTSARPRPVTASDS